MVIAVVEVVQRDAIVVAGGLVPPVATGVGGLLVEGASASMKRCGGGSGSAAVPTRPRRRRVATDELPRLPRRGVAELADGARTPLRRNVDGVAVDVKRVAALEMARHLAGGHLERLKARPRPKDKLIAAHGAGVEVQLNLGGVCERGGGLPRRAEQLIVGVDRSDEVGLFVAGGHLRQSLEVVRVCRLDLGRGRDGGRVGRRR